MLNWNLRFEDLIDHSFPQPTPDTGLAEAARIMVERSTSTLPVVEKGTGTLCGVIRRSAVLAALCREGAHRSSVAPLVEPHPRTVLPHDCTTLDTLGGLDTLEDILLVTQGDQLVGVVVPPALHRRNLEVNYHIIQTLLAAVPDPFLLVDEAGILRLCNLAMCDLLPGNCGGHLNTPLADITTALSALHFPDPHQTGPRHSSIQIGEEAYLAGVFPLHLTGGDKGTIISLKKASNLEEVQKELQLMRGQHKEFAQLIEFAFDGAYITDGDGNTLLLNTAYERITGLKREDLIGRNMRELVANKTFDQSIALEVIATGRPVTHNQKIKNGISVLVSGNPLFDENGRVHRVVATIRDMTELNRLREEITTIGSLKTQYEEELRELKKILDDQDEITFRSEAMRVIVDLGLRLGSVDSTVLIQGESGVGKEVIAELIHRNSVRRKKPFIKINCTAIPEQLLESELFGYVRGSFTGANKEGKIGLFEAADGGTLLLDEVGDLPMPLQAKLLRVIQERKVRRIGDNTSRNIDVRLLAATHRNLSEMIESGCFREDLYYRLNVVPLYVPPLRERKEDILLLVQKFLQKYCKRHSLEKELHPSALPVLLDYPWPGNVRELENIIERIVVTSPNMMISPRDLPPVLLKETRPKIPPLVMEGGTLKQIMGNLESTIIKHAFAQYKSTGKVAKALGVHRSNIVRKAQRLGLSGLLQHR